LKYSSWVSGRARCSQIGGRSSVIRSGAGDLLREDELL
jgi:hypothetical protein